MRHKRSAYTAVRVNSQNSHSMWYRSDIQLIPVKAERNMTEGQVFP